MISVGREITNVKDIKVSNLIVGKVIKNEIKINTVISVLLIKSKKKPTVKCI